MRQGKNQSRYLQRRYRKAGPELSGIYQTTMPAQDLELNNVLRRGQHITPRAFNAHRFGLWVIGLGYSCKLGQEIVGSSRGSCFGVQTSWILFLPISMCLGMCIALLLMWVNLTKYRACAAYQVPRSINFKVSPILLRYC